MPVDYQTLDLRIRRHKSNDESEQLHIEAIGPKGEWAKSIVPTDNLRDILNTVNNGPGLDISGDLLADLAIPRGNIRELYKDVLERTLPNYGLRLKLHLLEDTRDLVQLPWESIRIKGNPIAKHRYQSIVRTIDICEPATSMAVEKPPYRILMVNSSPKNLSDYGLSERKSEVDLAQIETLKSLAEHNLVQIESHDNVTIDQLENLLKMNRYQIFHFTGPVKQLSERTDWILFFTKANGEAEIVRSHHLGNVLLDTGVKMAFLNAIDTAGAPAEALLKAKLPVVVAYNGRISIAAARKFIVAFYGSLSKENSLERAMLAGRLSIAADDLSTQEWAMPVLFTRSLDGRFWTGKAGYKIETFFQDGRLVAEAKEIATKTKEDKEFDARAFVNRLKNTRDSVDLIDAQEERLKVKQLIAEVQDAIANSETDLASEKLSEASKRIYIAVSEQERKKKLKGEEEKAQREDLEKQKRARWIVMGMSVIWLLVVGLLSYLLRDNWTPSMNLPVIALPISVIVWSFVGGVAAMLQTFVGTKRESNAEQVNYEWLLWRPIVGVIMGSVIYLAIGAGLLMLGQGDFTRLANTQNPYFLWALAFLGGFSDKFTILVFDNIVRSFSKSVSSETNSE